MLERVEAEGAQRRRAIGPVDADHPAFLVEMVAVVVRERIGREVVHRDSPEWRLAGHIGGGRRDVSPATS